MDRCGDGGWLTSRIGAWGSGAGARTDLYAAAYALVAYARTAQSPRRVFASSGVVLMSGCVCVPHPFMCGR